MENKFNKGNRIWLALDKGGVIKYKVVEVLSQKKCYRIKEIRRDMNPYTFMPETRTFEEVHKAFLRGRTMDLLYG